MVKGHSEHKLSVVGKWALLSATFQHFLDPLESTTMYHDSSESRFPVYYGASIVTLNQRSPGPQSNLTRALYSHCTKALIKSPILPLPVEVLSLSVLLSM